MLSPTAGALIARSEKSYSANEFDTAKASADRRSPPVIRTSGKAPASVGKPKNPTLAGAHRGRAAVKPKKPETHAADHPLGTVGAFAMPTF